MTYRYLTADTLYPLHLPAMPEGVVVIHAKNGTIHDICQRSQVDAEQLEYFSGALVPGFINAHCHLELSHLKGCVPTHTGLIPFLEQVVTYRNMPPEQIKQAIADADAEMLKNGIVAVGDISNTADTVRQKANSRIAYTTFVEMFDFWQSKRAASTFDKGQEVYQQFVDSLGSECVSYVPHAPYTVSPRLMHLIGQHNVSDSIVSIHNQETPAENELFQYKTGAFLDFYKTFGFSLEEFEAIGKSSIHYTLRGLDSRQNNLLVHNTLTSDSDIAIAESWSRRLYWISCPNANLYIENRLPDYHTLIRRQAKVALGTDSFSSNWQLSILEEMKTIALHTQGIDLETLLQWACKNGAHALGQESKLGTLAIGKSPGINIISGLDRKGQLTTAAEVKRII